MTTLRECGIRLNFNGPFIVTGSPSIFTINFFNTHLRPEAFPMDTVIFTGKVQIDEYKEDRPREFEELEKTGHLGAVTTTGEVSEQKLKIVKFFGYIFLFTGIILVILIIYSLLFH